MDVKMKIKKSVQDNGELAGFTPEEMRYLRQEARKALFWRSPMGIAIGFIILGISLAPLCNLLFPLFWFVLTHNPTP